MITTMDLDFLDNLTQEQREVFEDKAMAYLFSTFTLDGIDKKEAEILALMEKKYPMEEVIDNPYILADYHGFCCAIKMLFPRLNMFLEAEADLYFELIELKNPDICKEMKTDG